MSTPRPRDAKTPKGGASKSSRLNLRVENHARQKLLTHCVMTGEKPGKLVSSWIDAYCKKWALPADLSSRGKSVDRQESTEEVKVPSATAA
jgi:hypothetical protein